MAELMSMKERLGLLLRRFPAPHSRTQAARADTSDGLTPTAESPAGDGSTVVQEAVPLASSVPGLDSEAFDEGIVERFLSFFSDAALPLRRRDNAIFFQRKRVVSVAEVVNALTLETVIDDVTYRHFRARLIERADRELMRGLLAQPDDAVQEIRLVYRNRRVGGLRATEARAIGGASITGNFLAEGDHWRTLAGDLPRAIRGADRVAPAPRAPVGGPNEPSWFDTMGQRLQSCVSIDDPPAGIGEKLQGQVLGASRRIREERCLGFPRTVTLEWGDRTVSFGMISHYARFGYIAPVRWQADGWDVAAAIELQSLRDPVRVLVPQGCPSTIQASVWASVILGFADLTCLQAGELATLSNVSHRTGPRSSSRTPAEPRSLPRAPWNPTLTPIGLWHGEHGPTYVCGHIRHLPSGQHASDEARHNAEAYAITLRDGQTWVQPHTRGDPSGYDIRFGWRPPEALARHLRQLAELSHADH